MLFTNRALLQVAIHNLVGPCCCSSSKQTHVDVLPPNRRTPVVVLTRFAWSASHNLEEARAGEPVRKRGVTRRPGCSPTRSIGRIRSSGVGRLRCWSRRRRSRTAGATGRCLQALEAVLLQQARRAGVAGGWRRCSNSGRDGMFFNGDAMDVGSRVFTLR